MSESNQCKLIMTFTYKVSEIDVCSTIKSLFNRVDVPSLTAINKFEPLH